MKHYRGMLPVFLLFGLIFPNFLSIGETTSRETLTIPFAGMITKYNLTGSKNAFPLPPAKFWAIWTEPNDSLITTRVEVVPDISLLGVKENGTVVENVTSRRMEAQVSGELLDALYNDYFSPDMPNYSPFWIFSDEITIGDLIPVWNFTDFTVESSELIKLDEYGEFDTWKLTHIQTNSTTADHDLTLIYEKSTGILLAARLWIKWIRIGDIYNIQFYLSETNVKLPTSDSGGINLLYLPLIGLFGIVGIIIIFQSIRTRELKGGI